MSSPSQFPRKLKLGDSELNLETAELRNRNVKTTIPAQPFQILLTLLDRQGALVTREELKQQLWAADTFVDFDQSLNKAVNRLREALCDSAEHPRFIETLPKRGYRFIGAVQPVNAAIVDDDSETSNSSSHALEAQSRAAVQSSERRSMAITTSLLLPLLVALLAFGTYRWIRRPLALTRVIRTVRITNDGWRKFALLGDGVRLYFSERGSIFQSSVEGGEITELHTGLTDLELYDISPGGSELLVTGGIQASQTDERPIWVVSLPAGTPRRIGSMKALWATWAPDGDHFAYATTNAIYLAKRDGTEIRKIGDTPAIPWKIQFSRDGTHLRFDGYDSARDVDSIWEMNLGGKVTSLFPTWDIPLHAGNWSADGKYFFFNSHDPVRDRDEDAWVLPESGVRNPEHAAARLTSGPVALGYPFPSPDGKKLFLLGTQSRAELTRYDSRHKQFVPYLGGISAWEAEVSRDGNWVVYVSYPDLTLWRSRLDGSARLQLTFPPIEVVSPRWSPDGTHIAFTNLQPGKVWKIYTISAQGGVPQQILPGDSVAEIDPSWTPDGTSIVFGHSYFDGKGGIQRVDLATRQVSGISGSENIFSPRLSPDGSKIAGFSEQGAKLMIYDFHAQEWSVAGSGTFQFNVWSHDGKSIYMIDMKRGSEIVCFDVDGRKFTTVSSLNSIEQGNRGWIGLAADDSPLLVRDKSVSDVYRLDLQIE